MKPANSAIDIMNQKETLRGFSLPSIFALAMEDIGTMAAIRQFMETSSGINVFLSATLYDPPAL